MGDDDLSYYWLLRSCWEHGETFIIVEQDIELGPQTIQDLSRCREPYCTVPYAGPGTIMENALGCAKFDAVLLGEYPHLIAERLPQPVTWHMLDALVNTALRGVHIEPHLHRPSVLHHHVYDGQCACGTDHPLFPVDNDGRYTKGAG